MIKTTAVLLFLVANICSKPVNDKDIALVIEEIFGKTVATSTTSTPRPVSTQKPIEKSTTVSTAAKLSENDNESEEFDIDAIIAKLFSTEKPDANSKIDGNGSSSSNDSNDSEDCYMEGQTGKCVPFYECTFTEGSIDINGGFEQLPCQDYTKMCCPANNLIKTDSK